MTREEKLERWHEIGDTLCHHLRICNCQRKLKSFVNILVHIDIKVSNCDWKSLSMEELMICALLERRGLLMHGTNCEYPIKMSYGDGGKFWEWLHSIKDDECLEDN